MSRSKLDAFTRAYIKAALWTTEEGADLDASDIAPRTLARMRSDCRSFQRDNASALEASGLDAEKAGTDFWLTRNRHGAGYWDRGSSAALKGLTSAAHAWGSFDLYVGDDRKVHGS